MDHLDDPFDRIITAAALQYHVELVWTRYPWYYHQHDDDNDDDANTERRYDADISYQLRVFIVGAGTCLGYHSKAQRCIWDRWRRKWWCNTTRTCRLYRCDWLCCGASNATSADNVTHRNNHCLGGRWHNRCFEWCDNATNDWSRNNSTEWVYTNTKTFRNDAIEFGSWFWECRIVGVTQWSHVFDIEIWLWWILTSRRTNTTSHRPGTMYS